MKAIIQTHGITKQYGNAVVLDRDNSLSDNWQQHTNTALYGIHQLFVTVTAFVLLYYMLSCLYTDRKDRSILFWKSMPVSENRNVAVKFITAVLVVPIVATLISWLTQICYLVLATVLVSRIGGYRDGNSSSPAF